MPTTRVKPTLRAELDALTRAGLRKTPESVIRAVVPADGERGPRFILEGSERPFLRMNGNGYLGLALHPLTIEAEEAAARRFGTGPQAVRFISGTFGPHVALEARLATFHGRDACMIYSSAYAAIMGVLPPLITADTSIISDALNHNCIINAIRLARPGSLSVYPHLDVEELTRALEKAVANQRRAIVVSDGVFSMRGDIAPLAEIADRVHHFDSRFDEGCLLVVDDSHGVGALGFTGRGTEEHTGARADVLVATLGKALGVNGGYAVASETVVEYLREKSPFYVYSNPITPAEAAAAHAAVDLLDSKVGLDLLQHLREMTSRFENGLEDLGYETIPGPHPVVPVLLRETARTVALVAHLRERGILATGLGYPVVPRGAEEVRFQVSAEHQPADIDEALSALASFEQRD